MKNLTTKKEGDIMFVCSLSVETDGPIAMRILLLEGWFNLDVS